MRIDLDVRRVWECPQCGRRRKTGGHVVARRCRCTDDGIQMRLVETGRQRRSFQDVIDRISRASAKDPTRQSDNNSHAENTNRAKPSE